MKFTFTTFLAIFSSFSLALAQQIGDWRMHINYNNVISLAYAENVLMGATEKSVFLYDFANNTTRTLDKSAGLSDFGVDHISYDDFSDAFVITYTNSNIDIFKDNTIINVPDIKNKLTSSSKRINNLFSYNGLCYISSDFGVVVLDVINEEIAETYVIGVNGEQVVVNDVAIVSDTIFALTAQGLKNASLTATNLLDFSQWNHSFANLVGLSEIEAYSNTLYGISNTFAAYNNGSWQSIFTKTTSFKKLHASNTLSFINGTSVYTYENNNLDSLNTSFLIDPTICIKTKGSYYFGDLKFGLFKENQKIGINNSPFTHQGFNAVSYNNAIAVISGGFNDNIDGSNNTEGGFYIFQDGFWNNYNIFNVLQGENVADYNRIIYNDFDNTLYIATFEGLIEYDFENATVYNDSNSPIDAALLNPGVQKVTGLATDNNGNVWVLNPETNDALLVKKTDGTWSEFAVSSDNRKMNDLLIDDNGQKWISLYGQGIIVYQEGDNFSATGAQRINLTTNANSGNLPNGTVICMAKDNDGEIWVGTAQGIAVFSCPNNVFDPSSTCRNSERITSTLDLYTEFLFETDRVSAIEVDGANRKWVGTSAGLFFMSEDGKTQLERFNPDNSPLPSTNITDITINKQTGEVFIMTDKGMVSYMGDATEPSENYDEVKAYPNPVPPNYAGVISIEGLVANAYVKITDTHGVLIDEGFALGGKYTWDGLDLNGNRARTGVYYIFSGNEKAEQKVATKIAIVR